MSPRNNTRNHKLRCGGEYSSEYNIAGKLCSSNRTLVRGTIDIRDTAFALSGLKHVPYGNEYFEVLREKMQTINNPNVLINHRPISERVLEIEARYRASERIIKNNIKQVVEIAAGFTPHAAGLCADVEKYIEIDLPRNSEFKKLITEKVCPSCSVNYVCGSVFQEYTWKQVYPLIDDFPTAIFTEGFMIYTDEHQRRKMLEFIKPILEKTKGIFFHEDCVSINPNRAQEYESLGFNIERIFYHQDDIQAIEYRAQQIINTPREQRRLDAVIKRIKTYRTWILRLQKEEL